MRQIYFNKSRALYLLGRSSLAAIFAAAAFLFSIAPIINDFIDQIKNNQKCGAEVQNVLCSIPSLSIPGPQERWALFVVIVAAIILLNILWFSRSDVGSSQPGSTQLNEGGTQQQESLDASAVARPLSGTGMHAALSNQSGESEPNSLAKQLPGPVPDFVGRNEERTRLTELLVAGETGVVAAVRGMGGVGKTALATVVANDVIDRFPDGQFWLNLRGARLTTTQDPFPAMRGIIHSLDVLAVVPRDRDSIANVYRAVLAEKRCLIVIDDAFDAEQAAPLIPPKPSVALITSRHTFQLAGMQSLKLSSFDNREALQMVNSLLGKSCRSLSLDEANRLASLCGGLPLAIRAACFFLIENPNWPVMDFLNLISDERNRLTALAAEDPDLDVRAVLGTSYERLRLDDPLAAKRWRMLSVLPSNFDENLVAKLWEVDGDRARKGLSTLLRRGLIEYELRTNRYFMHDLMRDIAYSEMNKNP